MAEWVAGIGDRMTRDQLIHEIMPRCYYFRKGEEGFRAVSELNTSGFVARRDLVGSKRREEWLHEKTRMSIQRPIQGEDWEILEQISKIRPDEHHFKTFLVWSLYLYLEVLATTYPNSAGKNGNSLTVLGACRAAGFLDPRDLRSTDEKFQQALEILGLWEKKTRGSKLYVQNILSDWKSNGTFPVIGLLESDSRAVELTEGGKTYKTSGAFMHLVQLLCDPQSPVMRTDNCISFSVALRKAVEGNPSSEKRFNELLGFVKLASQSQTIANGLIKQGDEFRFDRMLAAEKSAWKPEEIAELTSDQIKHSRAHFTNFLQGLPDSALRILYYTKQSLIHTEDHDLSNVLPKPEILARILNISEDRAKALREGQGLNEQTFRMIFASNGVHLTAANEELYHAKKIQTTMHELLHIAFGKYAANQFGQEFDDLKLEVERMGIRVMAVSYALLWQHPELLSEISDLSNQPYAYNVNPESPFYSGYNQNPIKGNLLWPLPEEILANLMGLCIARPHNPLMSGNNPALQNLYVLNRDLQALFEKIADRVEERALLQQQKETQRT